MWPACDDACTGRLCEPCQFGTGVVIEDVDLHVEHWHPLGADEPTPISGPGSSGNRCTEGPHLSLIHEGVKRVEHRIVGEYAARGMVQLADVQVVGVHPAQAVLNRVADALWPEVLGHGPLGTAHGLGVSPVVSHLGGKHHAGAPVGERAADDRLHASIPVPVGRVEQRHAPVKRGMQQTDCLVVAVVTPPPGGERIGTEADFGHGDAGARDFTCAHAARLPMTPDALRCDRSGLSRAAPRRQHPVADHRRPIRPGVTGAGGHIGLVLGVVLARFHQELEEVGHRKPPRLH